MTLQTLLNGSQAAQARKSIKSISRKTNNNNCTSTTTTNSTNGNNNKKIRSSRRAPLPKTGARAGSKKHRVTSKADLYHSTYLACLLVSSSNCYQHSNARWITSARITLFDHREPWIYSGCFENRTPVMYYMMVGMLRYVCCQLT